MHVTVDELSNTVIVNLRPFVFVNRQISVRVPSRVENNELSKELSARKERFRDRITIAQ